MASMDANSANEPPRILETKESSVWWGIAISLGIHAVILFAMSKQPLIFDDSSVGPFVEVEFSVNHLEEQEVKTLEESLRERLDQRVANLISNDEAKATDERMSSSVASKQMQRQVEEELRDLERAEFEKAQQVSKDFGRNDIPDDGQNNDINTMSEWQNRYNGRVLVSYKVSNRNHLQLPVPGYKCQVAGVVKVEVELGKDGRVEHAKILESNVKGSAAAQGCLEEEAIQSARSTIFTLAEMVPTLAKSFMNSLLNSWLKTP